MAEPEPNVRDDAAWPGGGEPRGLVAVYESRDAAERARAAAAEAGAPDATIAIAVDEDDPAVVAALRAEMQEETGRALVAPQAGMVFTREAMRTGAAVTVPLIVVCAMLALPLAAFSWGGAALWIRLVAAGLIGAAFGGTVGVIAGPALGAKRPEEPLAAQRGVVLQVSAWTPEVEGAISRTEPIRLDRIRPAGEFEVVQTEDGPSPAPGT